MKLLLIIGDGMADRPLKELSYSTPLEAAKPQNMNMLASNGISGLLYAVAPGIVPGSDVANLSILGYDPYKDYTGRGCFEAVGAGIELKEGDLAFRCNFATINDNFIVVDERAGRIHDDEADELEKELQKIRLRTTSDIQVVFRHTIGFKGAMVLRGENLCLEVEAPMPKAGLKADAIKPKDKTLEAEKTANALNEFIRETHRKLKNHPINKKREKEGLPKANAVIPWGGGKKPNLKSLNEKYELKGACVAAVSLIKGMCRLAGMNVIHVPEATGDINTNTMAKADAALKALKNHDFVMVHVEGPDEASHEGDVKGKIIIIRKIDSMVGRILEHISLEETCVTLLADHTTSTKLRKHTADPTPITIAGAEVIKDEVSRYSEREAYKGRLGHIRGKHVMPILLNLIGRTAKFGA
ncbi:MAG: 2,3-bisphosphoglycerate-independent phosphoglycerate mutase [Candidatus Bathyarchaeales archaeon]